VRTFVAGALIAVVLVAAGCGARHAANGSIPIRTVKEPTRTETYRMPSSSMEPTLHCARPAQGCEAASSDRVVVHEPVKDVKRGDVLLFETPPLAAQRCGAGGKFIKRVIGLPGEKWAEKNGYIYINGKKLSEPYLKPDRRDNETHSAQTIPKGRYFMLGDNRAESCDSRVWGTVPTANLIGKVVQIERPG
jgi:signal peptidase I